MPADDQPPSDAPVRSVLVVPGAGRSGTSLLSGLVHRLGYYVPQPEVVPDTHNPRGYGEPRWAVDFHNTQMRAVGIDMGETRPDAADLAVPLTANPLVRDELRDWLTRQFELSPRVIVKDPRLLWFLDLYRAVTDELGARLGVVSMVRHPAEAVHSADKVYSNVPLTTRLQGWITAALAVDRGVRGTPALVIRHADLLSDWRSALDPLDDLVPGGLLRAADADQRAAADKLIDPTLYRSSPDWSALDAPDELRDLAMRVYDTLPTSRPTRTPDELRTLDALDAEHRRLHAWSHAIVRSSILEARRDERHRTDLEMRAAVEADAVSRERASYERGRRDGEIQARRRAERDAAARAVPVLNLRELRTRVRRRLGPRNASRLRWLARAASRTR